MTKRKSGNSKGAKSFPARKPLGDLGRTDRRVAYAPRVAKVLRECRAELKNRRAMSQELRRIFDSDAWGPGDLSAAINALDMACDTIQELLDAVRQLGSAPAGYPECTSAVIRAMDEPHGINLLRVIHRNEELIAKLQGSDNGDFQQARH